jgi:hypothetical protein
VNLETVLYKISIYCIRYPLFDELGRTCGMQEEGERCLHGFGWEAQRKRPVGRPRHRWEFNIKMDLWEIVINGANWIWLAQDRVHW